MTFVYIYIYIYANYIPSMYVYVYILLTFMYIQHYCNCNVNCRFSLYIIYTRYAYHAQELGNHIPIRGQTIFGNGTAENSRHLLVMIYPGGTIYMYTFMYVYIDIYIYMHIQSKQVKKIWPCFFPLVTLALVLLVERPHCASVDLFESCTEDTLRL